MAEHRKTFRQRRLFFGGRPANGLRHAGLPLLLALATGSALAEDIGLKNGAASLSAGKFDTAVRQLSATVNSDSASPGEAARALYLRGIAYRKTGEQARAIADLGAAIWLGLPPSDRVRAIVNRGLAYRSAGLAPQADAEFKLARSSGGSAAVDRLIAEDGGSGAGTEEVTAFATDADRGAASSSSGGFLSNFGLGSRKSSEPAPPPPAATPASPPTRTADASPGSWDTTVSDGSESSSSAAPSGGSRLSRWFGSGGSAASSAPPPPSEASSTAPNRTVAAASPSAEAAPKAPTSGWGATTQGGATMSDAAPAPAEQKSGWRLFSRSAEAEASPPPAAPAASSSAGGGFRLQFAASKSEEEANALWKKVSVANSDLGGKQHAVKKTEIGSFGTFYSLTVGPFASKADTMKVCSALKRSGLDCFLEGSEGG